MSHAVRSGRTKKSVAGTRNGSRQPLKLNLDELDRAVPLSRQRAYQFRHRELGLCWLCPEKVYRACLCEKHYQMRRIESREKYHRDNPGSRRYLNAQSYQVKA